MYPINSAEILRALGYIPGAHDGESDFVLRNALGVITLTWNHADPQPTEQQINDYASDTTPLPSGQLFSQWQAEHGGDAVQTLRRKAKEALDDQAAEQFALSRAIALVVLDEINLLRAEHALAARTPAQLRNAIKSKLTAGDADS